jgi:hypothetical protein
MNRLLAMLIFGVALPGRVLVAQGAEALYGAGAFRLAADSFAARARAAPDAPANWYNLGNALYRAGDDAAARAAWIRAARAAPRDGDIRQALNLVQAPDLSSATETVVPVVTPGEVMAVALVFWVIGWILATARRPARHVIPVFVVAVVVGVIGFSKAREYLRPLALVRHTNTALRAAPFASAATRRSLNDGATVEILGSYAGWVQVRRGNEEGWLQRTEVVPLTGRGT